MDRLHRGLVFWVLLFVSIALPISAQKAVKKSLFVAQIATESGFGVGSSSIVLSTSSPEYRVVTFNLPGQAGTKVAMVDPTWGGGEVVLCENGGTAGNCDYNASGNLDIEGSIVGPMLPPGVTGGMFIDSLRNGRLSVRINNGSAGSGVYFQVL